MVIDAAKGIETQTRKLFEVCRSKGLPMLTFINKLDLPSRDPFELLDEIERVLQIAAAPINWPIGDGDRFRGVYDLRKNQVLLYERTLHNARRAEIEVSSIDDPALQRPDRRGRGDAPARIGVAGRRGRHAVRSRGLPARRADAGVLRQRALELRPRAVPARR